MSIAAEPTSVQLTLERLEAVLAEEDYDENFLKPTSAAYEFARRLIGAAEPAAPAALQPASPAPVGDGGLAMQWGDQDRYVRLLVPADPGMAYIYRKAAADRRTFRTLTGTVLADCWKWLVEE
jgi:hypothetical protein